LVLVSHGLSISISLGLSLSAGLVLGLGLGVLSISKLFVFALSYRVLFTHGTHEPGSDVRICDQFILGAALKNTRAMGRHFGRIDDAQEVF
jgi:hypothetical protein